MVEKKMAIALGKKKAEQPPKELTEKEIEKAQAKAEKAAQKNWYADRYQAAKVQRNILLIICIISVSSSLIITYMLGQLSNKKTYEPYLIQVEDKSGIVTQINQRSLEKYRADEVMAKYFLVKYLEARESYNFYDYRYFYTRVVRLMSSGSVYSTFSRYISTSNAKSPVKLGSQASVHIEIKSMTNLAKQKIQIRYAKVKTRGEVPVYTEDAIIDREHKIATINYGFFDLNLNKKDRFINPLGFQVTSIRIDEDAVQ